MVSVQVIVPCYNYGRYLAVCVGSILAQPGVDTQVLIIDDASTDGSGDVCEAIASTDSRIRVIRHETNRGHIETYNEGLRATTADYVVLLSADDLLAPGALQRATQLMEAQPSVGFVYGHPRTVHGDVIPPPRAGRATWTVWSGDGWLERMCRSGRNFICCPEVVMRASIQHRIGGYNPALPHSGDMEMWMRAARVSDVGRVNNVDQAYYRVHAASMQRTVHSGVLFDLGGRLAAYESALSEGTGEIEQRLDQAHRSLAVIAVGHVLESLQCDKPLDGDIDDYLSFAQTLFPGVVATRRWKLVERCRGTSRGFVSAAWARARSRILRSLEYRYWRRRGVEWPVVPRYEEALPAIVLSERRSRAGSISDGVSRTSV